MWRGVHQMHKHQSIQQAIFNGYKIKLRIECLMLIAMIRR